MKTKKKNVSFSSENKELMLKAVEALQKEGLNLYDSIIGASGIPYTMSVYSQSTFVNYHSR